VIVDQRADDEGRRQLRHGRENHQERHDRNVQAPRSC
jgi:hypothetical protein